MLAVIQRVKESFVEVNNTIISKIENGYLILLGVEKADTMLDIQKVVEKISTIRIMSDEEGKMNKSIIDVGGEIMVVSQFTLCADIYNGRRPSFINAADPQKAEEYYQKLVELLRNKGLNVQTGQFRAKMQVQLINDGPITFVIDSAKL